jgi:prepilin-type processing-associated H-X9-DG protein
MVLLIPGNGPNEYQGQKSGFNIDNLNNVGGIIHNDTGMDPVTGLGVCQIMIPVFQCPACPWPKLNSNGNRAKSNYLANMGSDTSGGNWASWTNPNGGTMNGVLLQANNNNRTWAVNIASITDGTSNTAAIGEVTPNKELPSGKNGEEYQLLQTDHIPIWAGGTPNWQGQGRQHNYFRLMDRNYPLNLKSTANSNRCFGSQHPNGANFLFCDVSVRMLNDDINRLTYEALGTRNREEVVTAP